MNQTKKGVFLWALGFILGLAAMAHAHFGMVIPTDTMVMQADQRVLRVTLSFSHPMEGIGMVLKPPKAFTVWANGQTENLRHRLTGAQVMDHGGWELAYTVKRPGVYIFSMEPQPYWEPSEDCYIIHLTKTVVTAFGDDQGWDTELGLQTEIVPLSKPYGLYAGNVFQGIVKKEGRSVPYAPVEVEYYNPDQKVKAPTDYMVTQTIKADANGVFTYAAPAAGWWGFAALSPADFKIKRDGREKDVELGAVIWVRFHSWN